MFTKMHVEVIKSLIYLQLKTMDKMDDLDSIGCLNLYKMNNDGWNEDKAMITIQDFLDKGK